MRALNANRRRPNVRRVSTMVANDADQGRRLGFICAQAEAMIVSSC